jgi:hypothetical protein
VVDFIKVVFSSLMPRTVEAYLACSNFGGFIKTVQVVHGVVDTAGSIGAMQQATLVASGNTKGGKYHCTVDLLFDLFGLVSFANKNKNCQLSYS